MWCDVVGDDVGGYGGGGDADTDQGNLVRGAIVIGTNRANTNKY